MALLSFRRALPLQGRGLKCLMKGFIFSFFLEKRKKRKNRTPNPSLNFFFYCAGTGVHNIRID